MQIIVIRLRNTLLIGVFPPVDAFTLLLPYPPNAGKAMKQPPTRLAIPSATSSRFALSVMSRNPSAGVVLMLFAATEDSKNPRSAMRKEVPMASRTCFMCPMRKGQWKGNIFPVEDLIVPRISSPFSSHPNFQVKTADRTTTINLSGT